MILVFDVWKKSQALKGMGLKYQGKKNQLLYILSHGDTENFQHPSSFMMFIFIFLQHGGILSIMKILCEALNTLSLFRSGGFLYDFHFSSVY